MYNNFLIYNVITNTYIIMKQLIQQDDCAPDSLDHFNKELKDITGETIRTFRDKGLDRSTNEGKCYIINNYILEYYWNNAYWILYNSLL